MINKTNSADNSDEDWNNFFQPDLDEAWFDSADRNMDIKTNSTDNKNADADWIKFFQDAGIEPKKAEDYSKIFLKNSVAFENLGSMTEVKFSTLLENIHK